MKNIREERKNLHTQPGANGKPSEEKIKRIRKRLFREYSKAWEELADH